MAKEVAFKVVIEEVTSDLLEVLKADPRPSLWEMLASIPPIRPFASSSLTVVIYRKFVLPPTEKPDSPVALPILNSNLKRLPKKLCKRTE